MTRPALIVFVLSGWVAACSHESEDTAPQKKWPRTIEARLSGAEWRPCPKQPLPAGRVVQEARCSADQPLTDEPCDRTLPTRSTGQHMLVFQKRCVDEAIGVLETVARADPDAVNDLAAAYYVRAQHDDRPSDLLPAYDAAARAVAIRPNDAAARFNLALIQEAIGLREDALTTWKAVPPDGSQWANEAHEHRIRLERELARDPTKQWDANRKLLPAALQSGNANEVLRLIAPFPKSALRYFEEELLPRGDARAAQLFASQLSKRLGGDPYVIDVAAAISRNREGHAAFAEARRQQAALQHEVAAKTFAQAADLLRRGGSPLDLQAGNSRALSLSFLGDLATAREICTTIDNQAKARKYSHLAAGTQAIRASILDYHDRHLESLAGYATAAETYNSLGDAESLASLYRSTAGIYRKMGHHELAWREALRGLRYVSGAAEIRIRHTAIGEAAKAALALGHADVALRLEESAITAIEGVLTAIDPERTEEIEQFLKRHLAVAFRERANIEIRRGAFDAAGRDLENVIRLGENETNTLARRVFESHAAEVQGKAFLRINPARAAAEFTRALTNLGDQAEPTFRTSLRVQRAEAYRRAGRAADAERDLQQALAELQEEERSLLGARQRGQGEGFWTSYFARFQEAYERLIGQLVEEDRIGEAFAYAERSRAFEPLDLVLKLPFVPPAFRKLTQGGNPIALEGIQRSLPAGTFLLQYSVTDARTYAWIVSRDGFQLIDQEVRRQDIRRWSATLQRAGRQRDAEAFDIGSFAPYDKLLRRPIDAATAMNGGRIPERLVIVPDDAMHGLPFAALRHPDTRRYLIQDTTIEIAGSATLYVFSLMRSAALSTAQPSALLIGDPDFNEQLTFAYGLKRLAGAVREVEGIRGDYAPRVEVRMGAEATVEELLALARDKTVLHFAGHAIVNPEEPARSLLLLAPSVDRSGVLEAQELLTDLKLDRTRLVVLAACSSAGGSPVGPEGVAPLVRPFIAAGVPAVAGSLWDVDDATAATLFVSFHHDYRQSGDAAAALRAAQVKLLGDRNPGLRSVLTWAPFQVIGH